MWSNILSIVSRCIVCLLSLRVETNKQTKSNANAALLTSYFIDKGVNCCVIGVPKAIEADLRSPPPLFFLFPLPLFCKQANKLMKWERTSHTESANGNALHLACSKCGLLEGMGSIPPPCCHIYAGRGSNQLSQSQKEVRLIEVQDGLPDDTKDPSPNEANGRHALPFFFSGKVPFGGCCSPESQWQSDLKTFFKLSWPRLAQNQCPNNNKCLKKLGRGLEGLGETPCGWPLAS